MQKLLALILSVIMAFLNLIPGFSGLNKDTMKVGEWLSLANETFGMVYDAEGDVFEGVSEENEYYEAVQTAYQWGILEGFDTIDPDKAVDGVFAAVALVRYAKLTGGEVEISNAEVIEFIQEVTIAVANGIFDLDEENGFFTGKLTRDEAIAAINKAFEIWQNKEVPETENEAEVKVADGVVDKLDGEGYEMVENTVAFDDGTDVKEGDTVALAEGVFTVTEATETTNGVVAEVEEADIADGYDAINMTTSMDPNLALAEVRNGDGFVLKEAVTEEQIAEQWELKDLLTWDMIYDLLLDYAEFDFDIELGDFEINIAARLIRDGFEVCVSGYVCEGVHVARTYSVTKLHLDTKFKANLKALKIQEAYLIADYDCVETTVISGSYAANLVEIKGEDGVERDFFQKIKDGLIKFTKGAGKRIVLYQVEIPIPNVPGFFFTIQFGIQFNINGRIQVVVTSHETKGIEIINNKPRIINETQVYDRDINIYGNFRLMFYADFILAFTKYNLLDLALAAGVGADVVSYVYIAGYTDKVDPVGPTDNTVVDQETGELIVVEDLPLDVAIESASSSDNFDDMCFCADVVMYGIITISIGENSLLEEIGLDYEWELVNKKNGTFLNLHIEDSGIVEECTRPDAKAA